MSNTPVLPLTYEPMEYVYIRQGCGRGDSLAAEPVEHVR